METMPIYTVKKTVSVLSLIYSSFILRKETNKAPSAMLWGAPGVGKSQGVRELAQELKEKTGKEVVVTDVRLLLFNPIDLRGIPTADKDKTNAIWLRPKIFAMDPSDNVINILFLDELSSAPQSVQAAAYQIALDHQVGEHKLPDNCLVIAAGNRLTDQSVVVKMPKALANRLLHITVIPEFLSWKEWAVKHQVNDKVIAYLSYRPEALTLEKVPSEILAFPTPRAWEKVSDIFNAVSNADDTIFDAIGGLIGTGAAYEFKAYCRVYKDLPCIEDIFKGKVHNVPNRADQLYALVSGMTNLARSKTEDMDQIENSIEYALSLPPEFSYSLIQDYLTFNRKFISKLILTEAYQKWSNIVGSKFNAN